jgi:flagellar biosynthesis/type III secretory pathway protein FliH
MPEGGGVLNKKVLAASDKAQAIIDEAVLEADKIKDEATELKARIAREMEKAKKDGYAIGREDGMSSVTEKAVALQHVREKFYKNAEPEMIKLVMTIAEKIIGKMVRENESSIKSIVRQAVESALGERITVKLNPEDYKIVSEDEHDFKDVFDRTKRIVFKEDETIKKGGCMVETEVGTIDARLETQLKAIRKALEL